jgi:Galactose oxidase-like, Early set domain
MSTGWQVPDDDSDVLAVHAAMLHTGKILYFGGDEHDRKQHVTHQLDHTRLFDCETLQVGPAPSPTTDVFCAGHAMLGDGRLLVAGGTESFPHEMETMHEGFTGLRDTWIFRPGSETWVHAADLCHEPGKNTGGGRWYPTLVTLPNGRVLAVGGIPMQVDSRMLNNSPEVFRPTPAPKGQWKLIAPDDPANQLASYPRLHVLPDGRIFSATPTKSAGNRRLNTATAGWADVCAAPSDVLYRGIRSSSVLLPLLPWRNYRPRVLLTGGSQPLVVDLGASSPTWRPTAPRTLSGSPRRIHGSAVLMPTGDVFVCGGVRATGADSDRGGVMKAELYQPTTNRWHTLQRATVVRNYHSVALLMPDGRVWTAGSNHNGAHSFPEPNVDNRELRIEIYEPAYVAQSRPKILDAPTTITCGKPFTLNTTQAHSIRRVALIRTGSVTHGFNSDQRYVACTYDRSAPHRLDVSAPPNGAIAPPGYYLLFLVNQNRVPSKGRFVRVKQA